MARIRSIRPEFFSSLDVAALGVRARLTWIALWCHADDEGRGIDDARLIRAFAWPLDDEVKLSDVSDDLDVLEKHGRIIRYAVEGRAYFEIPNFTRYQRPNKPLPSKLPAPPVGLRDDSGSAPVAVEEDYTLEGRGIGIGGGAPPSSRYCSKHPKGTDGPCIGCMNARRAFDDAAAVEKSKPTVPGVVTQPDCPRHPGYPHPDLPHGCPRCQEEAQGQVAA